MVNFNMKKTPFAYVLAILDLGVSYLSFTDQQHFSVWAMLSIFVLALLSAITFFLSGTDYFDRDRNGSVVFVSLLVFSLLIAFYSLTFNLISPSIFNFAVSTSFLVGYAVAISVISIYAIGIAVKERAQKGADYKLYAVVLVCLVIASVLAYEAMYGLSHSNWNGVDELAYNYYASYLFLHGANPYTQSMEPILTSRGIYPSVVLNGSYEYEYDYPALSFLAYVPVTALGISSPYSFVFILIFFSIFSAFAVYWKSGFGNHVLIPIAAWLFLSFSLVSVSNTFLAVSIFLLFSYILKKKPVASGLLLGLAASVTQLTWFALPFFFVLMLRQHGKKAAAIQFLVSGVIFVLINLYFVILSPSATIRNLFAFVRGDKTAFLWPKHNAVFRKLLPCFIPHHRDHLGACFYLVSGGALSLHQDRKAVFGSRPGDDLLSLMEKHNDIRHTLRSAYPTNALP